MARRDGQGDHRAVNDLVPTGGSAMTATTKRLEPDPERDWSSRAGAEALASNLRAFWHSFGGFTSVKVWIEPGRGGSAPLWIVKSTLRGGLPPPTPASPAHEVEC
jgi:hypothetical protein